jgi:hypothetical protein
MVRHPLARLAPLSGKAQGMHGQSEPKTMPRPAPRAPRPAPGSTALLPRQVADDGGHFFRAR